MTKRRPDLILHNAERAIADAHGCSVADVNSALDQHFIETDREKYLRRALALQLCERDEVAAAHRAKALGGDVASGTLLIKVAERKATLLGLNTLAGFSVTVTLQPTQHLETSVDCIERVLADPEKEANGPAASQDGEEHDCSTH